MKPRESVRETVIEKRWGESRGAAGLLVLAYVLFAALPVVMAAIFGEGLAGSLINLLGRWSALLGFSLLCLQVIAAAQLKLLDRPFGLDAVILAHRRLGMLTLLLLFAHPVLLAVSMDSYYLFSFDTAWQVSLGKLGLLLTLAGVLAVVVLPRVRIDYLWTRFIHSWLALVAVGLFFAHGLLVGSDLDGAVMRIYWWLLLAATLCVFIFHKVVARLWGRHRFNVVSVRKENYNTWTLRLEPMQAEPLTYRPGQFMFLSIKSAKLRAEEHPFSISSSPTGDGALTVTVKESGDYTRTIGRVGSGDQAYARGPYGRFSCSLHDPESMLFLAGGVGITPVMSMLRWLRDRREERPITLLYANRTARDIIFRKELDELPENFSVTHVLSEALPDWDGPSGHVTAEIIREHAGELLGEAEVYLCGPPGFMRSMRKALKSLGVSRRRIHYERFAL